GFAHRFQVVHQENPLILESCRVGTAHQSLRGRPGTVERSNRPGKARVGRVGRGPGGPCPPYKTLRGQSTRRMHHLGTDPPFGTTPKIVLISLDSSGPRITIKRSTTINSNREGRHG